MIVGLAEARVLKEIKEMRGRIAGWYRFKNMFFRSLIGMNNTADKTINKSAAYDPMTPKGSMKGTCSVCRKPVELIESCVETLDIHYLSQGVESQLCPGSGTRPMPSGM